MYHTMDITENETPERDEFVHAESDTDVNLVNHNRRNTGSELTSAFKEYSQNIYLVSELLVCALIGGFGHTAPNIIFGMTVLKRDVPYQATVNGDVLFDLYLNRDFEDETISDWLLVCICLLLPFVTVLLFAYKFGKKYDLHCSACCFLFAFGSNEFITSFVKLYVGYWRPNFYSFCGITEDYLDCNSEEPRKSFPSGHASSSFCGMTLFTIYFLGKLGFYSICLTAEQNENVKSTAFLLLKKRLLNMVATLPMFLAVFIAASRVHDNFHHPADIVAGSLIGMFCAVFSYGLWYSPLSSEFSGYPINAAYEIVRGRRIDDTAVIQEM